MGLLIGLGLGLDRLQFLLAGFEVGLGLGQLRHQRLQLRRVARCLGVQHLIELIQHGDIARLFQQLGGEPLQLGVGGIQPGLGVHDGLFGLRQCRLQALAQDGQRFDARRVRGVVGFILYDGRHLVPNRVQVDIGHRLGNVLRLALQAGDRHDRALQVGCRVRKRRLFLRLFGLVLRRHGFRAGFGFRLGHGLRFLIDPELRSGLDPSPRFRFGIGHHPGHVRRICRLRAGVQPFDGRFLLRDRGVQPLDGRFLLGDRGVQPLDGRFLFGDRGAQFPDGRVLFGDRGVHLLDGRVLFGNRCVQPLDGRVLFGNRCVQASDGLVLLADQAFQLGHPGLRLSRLGFKLGHLFVGSGQVRLQLLVGRLAVLHLGGQRLGLGLCLRQLGADILILGLGRIQICLERRGIVPFLCQLGLRGGEGFLAGVQLAVEKQYRDDGEHQQHQQHDLPHFAFGIHNTASLCIYLVLL